MSRYIEQQVWKQIEVGTTQLSDAFGIPLNKKL